jgi:hypothetical protein
VLFFGAGIGRVWLSLGGFRAPAFSLRVARDDRLEELELFMKLLGTYCELSALIWITAES